MDDTSATATDDGGPPMEWTEDEARVLGALMEKALATPQNYPLSLNALTLACNQTTNRDPVMELGEAPIQDVLAECKVRGLARFVHPRSGRGVTKYRQVADEVLGLGPADLALLSVLLLRGPQTVGELRTRTDRLHRFDGSGEVETVLVALSASAGDGHGGLRPPLVRRLEREAGHREARWIQLLCPAQGEGRIGETADPGFGRGGPEAAHLGAMPERRDGSRSATPQEAEEWRQEIGELRQELADLRAEFEAFRSEFN